MNPLPDGNGATTEIGSVPDLDPAAAALDALRRHPRMAFVPELVRRDPREGMLERCVCGRQEALPSHERASAFHALLSSTSPRDASPRPLIKFAVAGPVVMARNGRRFDQGLAARMARALRSSGWDPVVQIDEPGVTDDMTEMEGSLLEGSIGAARRAGAHVVVHDCGATQGRHLITLSPDAISVDATRGRRPLLVSDDRLAGYLRSGGSVIWGLIPTDGRPPPERIVAPYALDGIGSAIGDRALARRRGWLSPACGLGTLTMERAEEIRRALLESARGWT